MTADVHPPEAKLSGPGAKDLVARFSAPAVLVVALTVNLWSLASVPFHPDEATWIFMSRDLALMAREGPGAVCWQPDAAADPVALERARTAPLPRHILGLERLAGILPAGAVPVDWDWTTTWAVNAERGAVPSASVLLAARLPIALLTSFAELLVFLIARRIGGAGAGWAAALLFIFNPLMLVHGRRAMSEAALVFGVCLAVWLMMRLPRSGLIQGAGVALGVLAKHSGVVIAPAALLSALWPVAQAGERAVTPARGRFRAHFGRVVRTSALMALGFVVVFGLLSPSLWCHPLSALDAMLRGRTSLVDAQVEALRTAGAAFVLATPAERVVALIDRVFVASPVFWEIPNYAAETAASEAAYMRGLMANQLRGPVWGSVLLALALLGAAIGALLIFRRKSDASPRRDLALVLMWTLGTALGLLALVPFAWQRYYVPLIPALCVWQGYALGHVARAGGLLRGAIGRPST
jgi:hypothetical protein